MGKPGKKGLIFPLVKMISVNIVLYPGCCCKKRSKPEGVCLFMKKGILFKCLRSIVVLVAALMVAAFLLNLGSEPARGKREQTIPLVQVIEAQPETQTMTVEAFGTVEPRETLS